LAIADIVQSVYVRYRYQEFKIESVRYRPTRNHSPSTRSIGRFCYARFPILRIDTVYRADMYFRS